MTLLQTQLLTLLRCGLWNDIKPSPELFPIDTDWLMLFKLAKQQTIAALVWDGIMKLPATQQPPTKLRMQWLVFVVQVEKTNQLLNHRVVELFDLYQKSDIQPVLLKGQGLATHYPNPLHRQCGDIDIYVSEQGFEAANKATGVTDYSTTDKHSHFSYKEVHVENHHLCVSMHHPQLLAKFKALTAEWYPNNAESVLINNTSIAVPPHGFNALFIFLHFYHHFITSGIGLRQICDWVVLLNSQPTSTIDLLGHERTWKVFSYIAVNHLGLPKEKMPYYDSSYEKKASRTMDMIFADGNFGFNDTNRFTKRPKGYFSGKLFSFLYLIKHTYNIGKIFPKEAYEYLLKYQIRNSLKVLIKDKFNV